MKFKMAAAAILDFKVKMSSNHKIDVGYGILDPKLCNFDVLH